MVSSHGTRLGVGCRGVQNDRAGRNRRQNHCGEAAHRRGRQTEEIRSRVRSSRNTRCTCPRSPYRLWPHARRPPSPSSATLWLSPPTARFTVTDAGLMSIAALGLGGGTSGPSPLAPRPHGAVQKVWAEPAATRVTTFRPGRWRRVSPVWPCRCPRVQPRCAPRPHALEIQVGGIAPERQGQTAALGRAAITASGLPDLQGRRGEVRQHHVSPAAGVHG